jgi:negative regulator of replication initiation
MQFRQIEIDFDIHKLIELERRGFDEAPNAVLRRLLKLPEKGEIEAPTAAPAKVHASAYTGGTGRPFIEDGVSIPHGSLARMEYLRGSQVYEGQFLDGKLVVNGVAYPSLSNAADALAITKKGEKTSLNGWRYWEVRRPGETAWVKLWDLREAVRRK